VTDEVQRPRLLVGGLTLLAFLSGAAGGAITTHMLEQRAGAAATEPKAATPAESQPKPQPRERGDRDHRRGGPGGPGGGPRRGHDPMDRLVRDLKLTEEEAAKVRGVYESQRAAFEAVFQEFRPKMEQVRKETNDAVRAVLPAEKQEAFDKLITEEEKRRETRGGERERERERER